MDTSDRDDVDREKFFEHATQFRYVYVVSMSNALKKYICAYMYVERGMQLKRSVADRKLVTRSTF